MNTTATDAATTHASGGSIIGGLLGLVFLTAMYFGPTIIALARKHRSVLQIGLVNFFFGWTVIGWILALIWAFGAPSQSAQQTIIVQANATNHPPPAPIQAAPVSEPPPETAA